MTSISLQIRTLEPAVYIYCQNPLIEDFTPLQPLFLWGGEIKHTENLGRESHAFLLYILQHYQELPNLVLFSQDAPEEHLMRMRIEVRNFKSRRTYFIVDSSFRTLHGMLAFALA